MSNSSIWPRDRILSSATTPDQSGPGVVYSYADACRIITTHKDDATQFLEKYTSHFIWKGCVWEGVGDRTELQHIDPHSYGHQRCVFLILQGCSTGGPGTLFAGCWLSLPHLVTNGSGLQTNWLPIFTELYNSSIAHSISPPDWPSECVTSTVFGMACLIIIKWKYVMQFTGHSFPVYQSVSVPWDFNPVPYCQPDSPMPMEYSLPPSLEWHVWRGRRSIYYTGSDGNQGILHVFQSSSITKASDCLVSYSGHLLVGGRSFYKEKKNLNHTFFFKLSLIYHTKQDKNYFPLEFFM